MNTTAGKYAMYWNGSALSTPAQGLGSRSSGSMWPEMKKFKVMTMYRSDVTSRNQNPTMPTLASKKKPTTNASTSEARKASQVVASVGTWPTKKPRQRKNSRPYGSAEATTYVILWATR